ncbi:MAG: AI-2E family transporter, partial [Pseudomonadales bacterium]|nr:AI-2E family transporter [Pseudomonadales bacterium]
MLDVMRGWLDKYLSDEEAVLFTILLLLVFIVILTMGNLLAPVLTGMVLAFVMQGLITYLARL